MAPGRVGFRLIPVMHVSHQSSKEFGSAFCRRLSWLLVVVGARGRSRTGPRFDWRRILSPRCLSISSIGLEGQPPVCRTRYQWTTSPVLYSSVRWRHYCERHFIPTGTAFTRCRKAVSGHFRTLGAAARIVDKSDPPSEKGGSARSSRRVPPAAPGFVRTPYSRYTTQ